MNLYNIFYSMNVILRFSARINPLSPGFGASLARARLISTLRFPVPFIRSISFAFRLGHTPGPTQGTPLAQPRTNPRRKGAAPLNGVLSLSVRNFLS